jgi:hypothetical protein
LADRLDLFGEIHFIMHKDESKGWIDHFLGFGWDVTGVGVVHHLARFIFRTIENPIKWSQLA